LATPLIAVAVGLGVTQLSASAPGTGETRNVGAAIVTAYEYPHPRGVMVTSGGWAYCQQVRRLARNAGFTLLCGRYPEDGYLGLGQRARRHLDWGEPAYLTALAREAGSLHAREGGELVLLGVSYSGFGVTTLASHHPELRPDRVIVIDSYLDLAARRAAAGDGQIGREIDLETGGSGTAIAARNVRAEGLARLVEQGTRLQVIWSIASDEAREFKGATCNRNANAEMLQQVADVLGRPVSAHVTENRHGHDLWDHGLRIMRGRLPGRTVVFRPGGTVPPEAVCR
jgi:hypothetical protein